MSEAFELAGHELDSPLLNGAGSINGTNAEGLVREGDLLLETGIGGVVYGSFTIPPQAGNEVKYGSPVYYHDQAAGLTYNSMGLPNIGLEAAKTIAPELTSRAHDKGKIVVLSGSPTLSPEHGEPVHQAAQLAYELLSTPADMVEINVSCPNVVTADGGRKPILGHDLESMIQLVEQLEREVGIDQSLGLKLPPYLNGDEELVPDIAQAIRGSRVFRFLTVCNTIGNQVPTDENGSNILTVPGGKAGMSGPATKYVGREQLAIWHDQTDGAIDIISTLGVDGGKEMAVRLKMGASAVAGVTFLWESRDWQQAVTGVLEDYAGQLPE